MWVEEFKVQTKLCPGLMRSAGSPQEFFFFFFYRIDVVSGILGLSDRRPGDFCLAKQSMRRFLVHFVVSSRRVWPLNHTFEDVK